MAQIDDGHLAEGAGLGRIFLAILFLEALTIAALYAFGVHFAQP